MWNKLEKNKFLDWFGNGLKMQQGRSLCYENSNIVWTEGNIYWAKINGLICEPDGSLGHWGSQPSNIKVNICL